MRMASRSQTGTSANAPSSSSSSEEEAVFSCAIGFSSKTNEKKNLYHLGIGTKS